VSIGPASFSTAYGHVSALKLGSSAPINDVWLSINFGDASPDKWHHWSWWLHKTFINFLGSTIGRAAAYYLIFCRRRVDSLPDAFLLLVAMAGVFGFLPWLLFKGDLKK
jgi:hypothetical protein